MKFVIYHNMFSMAIENGFLVKETESDYHIMIPILHEWLERRNKLHLIDNMPTIPLHKEYFKLTENPYFSRLDDWIFDFPIDDYNEIEFYEICRFFEFQQASKHLEPIKMLEKSVQTLRPVIPKETILDLIDFTLKNMGLEEYKLKTILSGTINKVLFQNRKDGV